MSGLTSTLTLGINGDITTSGTISSGAITSSGPITSTLTSNQLVLGNADTGNHTTTINAATAGSNMTAIIPALTSLTGSDTFVFANQSQTLANKTLVDASTVFQNANSGTSQMVFDLSEITPGQTRVLTVPDMNGSLCLTTGNCAGTGGVVGGQGDQYRIAKIYCGRRIL